MAVGIDDIKIYELYSVWYDPVWYHIPWWSVFSIVLVICAALTLFFYRRYNAYRIKHVDPWQKALDQLSTLKPELFESAEHHKIFYTYLTGILKEYLSHRYGINLAGKTDQEVIDNMQSSEFPNDLLKQLQTVFQGAVVIKFSHQESAFDHMKFDLRRSIDIVRNTIPQVKQPRN